MIISMSNLNMIQLTLLNGLPVFCDFSAKNLVFMMSSSDTNWHLKSEKVSPCDQAQ